MEKQQNPLLSDPYYRRCLELATASPCQKMGFGALVVLDGLVVASSANKHIPELSSLCDPTCIRLQITSRTESMIGACGHAEEWALQEARDSDINLRDCDLYVAGVKANGEPYIKDEADHTCLRCAVQMNYAGIKSVRVPVIDRWVGISTAYALKTASSYALGIKKVEKQSNISKEQLAKILEESWDKQTSASEEWSPANKALGQCAVTACVVQDYLGGNILNTTATLPDGTPDSHYYNLIDDEEVDLTRSQFPEGTTFTDGAPKTKGYASTREYVLSHQPTNDRYDILKQRVAAQIS